MIRVRNIYNEIVSIPEELLGYYIDDGYVIDVL
jgi:hypothetical protein